MNDTTDRSAVPRQRFGAPTPGLALNAPERLDCSITGGRAARALTRRALTPLHRATLVHDAELCVAEAFGNAWRHTRSSLPGGSVQLSLYAVACGAVYIDVTDAGPLTPGGRPRVAVADVGDLDAECGRGMALIDQLAAHWLYVSTSPSEGRLCLIFAGR